MDFLIKITDSMVEATGFITVELITDMVLWISIGVSISLCILIVMIYFKDNWFEPNKDTE